MIFRSRISMFLVAAGATTLLNGCHDSPRFAEPWVREWALIQSSGEGGVPATDIGKAWIPGEVLPGKFGNRPHYDAENPRTGVLGLHPLSTLEPAKLRFVGTRPTENPILVVEAGGNIHGDCLLECRVNGELIGRYVLDGSEWTTCRFDLFQVTSDPVNLEIWNACGGAHPWNFEHCFIDDIYFAPANG